MHVNLCSIEVPLFPVEGILPDKAEPMLCPSGGRRPGAAGMGPTSCHLEVFFLFSLGSWPAVPSEKQMPHPFFTFPTLLLWRRSVLGGWCCGESSLQWIMQLFSACAICSLCIGIYFHGLLCSFLLAVFMYLFKTRTRGREVPYDEQQMSFPTIYKIYFCSKHLNSR